MKRTEKGGKRYSFWLSVELMDRVKELAKKADMSEGRMVSNMLETVTSALEASQKVGVFQLSLLIRDLQEALKGWEVSVKDEPQFVGKGEKLTITVGDSAFDGS